MGLDGSSLCAQPANLASDSRIEAFTSGIHENRFVVEILIKGVPHGLEQGYKKRLGRCGSNLVSPKGSTLINRLAGRHPSMLDQVLKGLANAAIGRRKL